MLTPIGVPLSPVQPVTPIQSQADKTDSQKIDATSQSASATPSSAQASQFVQPPADSSKGQDADLQSALNQDAAQRARPSVEGKTNTPQRNAGGGTAGINKEAIEILERVLESAQQADNVSAEDFRTQLSAELEASGLDPSKPMVDIRV